MRYPIMPGMSSVPLAAAARHFYPWRMSGKSGKSGDPKRSERLKAALRENLKRRKAQQKGRAQAGGRAGEHDSAGIASEIAPPRLKD